MTAAPVPPLSPAGLCDLLVRSRVVPVLRTPTADALTDLADLVLAAGFEIVELTATVPGWERVLERVLADERFDGVTVGVGTVTDASIARRAADLGARFLVSPFPVPEAVLPGGPILVQGGLTPGELHAAGRETGIAKLFPAASVGVAHLRAMRDVLPDLAIMPTGGITPANAGDWLDAGAIAVGMGTALFRLGADELAGFLADLRARP